MFARRCESIVWFSLFMSTASFRSTMSVQFEILCLHSRSTPAHWSDLRSSAKNRTSIDRLRRRSIFPRPAEQSLLFSDLPTSSMSSPWWCWSLSLPSESCQSNQSSRSTPFTDLGRCIVSNLKLFSFLDQSTGFSRWLPSNVSKSLSFSMVYGSRILKLLAVGVCSPLSLFCSAIVIRCFPSKFSSISMATASRCASLNFPQLIARCAQQCICWWPSFTRSFRSSSISAPRWLSVWLSGKRKWTSNEQKEVSGFVGRETMLNILLFAVRGDDDWTWIHLRRHCRLTIDVLSDNKELIIGPGLTLVPQLFSLPLFVAAFALDCQNLERSGLRHLLIVSYWRSSIPQLTSFFLYVSPSSFYFHQWRQTRIAKWIYQTFHRHPASSTSGLTVLSQTREKWSKRKSSLTSVVVVVLLCNARACGEIRRWQIGHPSRFMAGVAAVLLYWFFPESS